MKAVVTWIVIGVVGFGIYQLGKHLASQSSSTQEDWQAKNRVIYKAFFDEGFECGQKGIPDTACPYDRRYSSATHWLKGWIEGKKQSQEKK